MVDAAPLWSVLVVPVLLGVVATAAVVGDGLLAARAAGRPVTAGAAVAPLAEVPRLLIAQRRTTLAPDRLLWRLGVLTVPVAAVLAAAVLPLGEHVVADLDVGVVWFNAMEVLTWAAVWLAGWGPNAAVSAGRRLPVRRAGTGLRVAAHVRDHHGGAGRADAAGRRTSSPPSRTCGSWC